jgi:DNA primase
MANPLLLGYLENVLGKSTKKARENHAFICPFCNHSKPKLEVKINTNEKGENPWECWVCNTKGRTIKSLLRQLKVDTLQAQGILSCIKKGEGDDYYFENTSIQLPKEFQPLYNASTTSIIANKVRRYLYKRGITEKDFLKYNIGYITSGEYSNRVIVPSYDETNQLNYFVGRSFTDAYNKYKNPSASKEIIAFESYINWRKPIILVEGVFDAIAVKRNAVPILGKSLSKRLMKKLVSNDVQEIYIALDRDALKKALNYCEQFLAMGKRVYLVDMEDKDPSDMGFEKFTQYVQQAQELTLSKLLEYKLFHI